MSMHITSARAVVATTRAALAIAAAVLPVASAMAQSAQPAPLPGPAESIVEAGIGNVSDGSYKAGEYNGLQNKGAIFIGNVDLRDRATYDSPSALRWLVKGRNLGLDTRSVAADVRVQGRVRFRAGVDRLRRNRSDTYQTPYAGDGTDSLTLPSSWIVPVIASAASGGTTVSARGLVPSIGAAPYLSTAAGSLGAIVTPSAAQVGAVNAAAGADLPLFRNVNLFTTRTKYLAAVTYHVDDRWTADANVRPEHKEGLKPMGTVSRNTGGDISTIIPDRIDNDHTQFDTNLHFTGKQAAAQVGYYGSFFTNHVSSMSWENWASAARTLNTMSSAPSNTFWQVNGSGMVKMGATTRLVANAAFGHATQNDLFLTDSTTPVVSVPSLNGLVVTSLFKARMTGRPNKKLNWSASYKYDDRDNRTPIHIFQYADAGEEAEASALFPAGPNNPLGALLAQNGNANRPYGRTQNLVTLDGEVALAGQQWLKGGYDFDRIDRRCAGSWIDCSDADRTNENTVRVDWRETPNSALTARVGYARSWRRTPAYNENAFLALVPYANVSPTTATGGATALSFMAAGPWGPWGPALGYAATTGNMNVFFPSNNALANNSVRKRQPHQRSGRVPPVLDRRPQPGQVPIAAELAAERRRRIPGGRQSQPRRVRQLTLRPAERQGLVGESRFHLHADRQLQCRRVLHLREPQEPQPGQQLHRQ